MVKVEIKVNSFAANGGDGPYSYAKNSHFQRLTASLVKEKVDAMIMEKLDAKTLSSPTNKFCIADLGCATGPNTFIHIQNVIEKIEQNHKSKSPDTPLPEFVVLFNDLPTNDFNILFTTLPENKTYFAAGVPGSFHTRLFPESSVHFMLSFSALHWLSRVPPELLDEDSKAWNKGRVHYSSAPEEVVRAYEAQFGTDMDSFLGFRAKEMVSGGLMVIGMCGIPLGMPFSKLAAGIMYECMGTILNEMQNEGLVEEELVDSFNLNIYAATPEEITNAVEKNGFFTIEHMELMDPSSWQNGSTNITEWVIHLRAAMGQLFTRHFGDEITDQVFKRLDTKLNDVSGKVQSSYREKIMLFFVLKRK